MRPTPEDELRAIKSILTMTVLPAVTGEWPRAQVQHVIGVLDRLVQDWDRATPRLSAENAALEVLLEEVRAEVTALAPHQASHIQPILARATREDAADEAPHSFARLQANNVRLRRMVQELVVALEAIDEPPAEALQNVIRAGLRNNLERSMESTTSALQGR